MSATALRVFLDANILFSAAKSDGAVRALLGLLAARRHVCCIDGYVLEEARRNLQRKGPASLAALDELVATMEHGRAPLGREPVGPKWLDPKDRPVLAAAVNMRCDVLLTGDKTHFGRAYGRELVGVTVHSPRSLALLLSK